MGVPTNESTPFKMFDTGSGASPVDTSIRGAQLHDADDAVSGNAGRTFVSSKNRASLNRFHPNHIGPNVESLNQVVSASQFRGYPVSQADITCYKAQFTEITWPILNCMTWTVHALDDLATGSITQGLGTPVQELTACTNSGSTIYGSISTSSLTEFVGWSLTPDANNIESTGPSYGITMGDFDSQIYAIIRSSDAISIDVCYYAITDGQTYRCKSCENPRKVYFHRDTYLTSSLDDLIWYSDESLTTFASNGYYRPYRNNTTWWGATRKIINTTNYLITGSDGDAHAHSVCDGDFIYCT